MKYITKRRLAFVVVVLFVVIALFIVRLVKLQLIDGEKYYAQSQSSVVSTTVVKAPRGDILDRNCQPIVCSTKATSVVLNLTYISDINETVQKMIRLFESIEEPYIDTFPIAMNADGLYFLEDGYDQNASFKSYLEGKKLSLTNSAQEIVDRLCEVYKLDAQDRAEALKIIGVRYEIEMRSVNSFYTFAEDVSVEAATAVKENSSQLIGVYLEVQPVREYTEEYFASHIIGTVGRIYADEYETLKSQGYAMDDIVGKDGIEKVCENYLRGTNGSKNTILDVTGNVVDVIEDVPAQAGNDVILTIDKDAQMILEQELKTLLENCRKQNGEAISATAVFMDVNTGEILAMESYPTYNLATYNADFAALSKDESKPLVNRAISGLFPPGSTFKMVTATAGLESGVISRWSTQYCTGRYTYYADYQPTDFHSNAHKEVTVVSALMQSCNYFFFDTGRVMGIDTLNQYGKLYGFGQKTGIELPGEASGILAGAEYRQSIGKEWNAGETLLAAVGQSDNAATPLQLANYVASIANNGKSFTPHIIKSVRDKETGETVFETEIAYRELGISQSTLDTLHQGMIAVANEPKGTAYSAFKDFDTVQVAIKTGTAEVTTGVPDSLLVGYAPAQDPQIAFSVVVERGGTGTTSFNAQLVKSVLKYYFSEQNAFDSIDSDNTLLS